MPPEGQSAFELERERRIQENKQKLAELGLLQASQALREACEGEAKPAKRAPVKPRQREMRLVEVRRSGRERRMPENFTYREEDRPAATREPATRKRKACVVVRTWSSQEAGWHPSMGEASLAAADRATDAAEELGEQLQNWYCIKRMTPSQVSTGFWCSAPATMAVALKRTNRADKSQVVKLVLGKHGQHGEGAAAAGEQPEGEGEGEEEERSWDSIWLPHGKGSWGFSGGWRGFAIDQELYPSDAVLYEVLPPSTPGQPSDTVRIYIFRAFDYETPALRDEIKAKAAAGAAAEEDAEDEEQEEGEEEGEEGGSEGQGGAAAPEKEGQQQQQSGARARELAAVDEGLLSLGSQGQQPAAAPKQEAEGRPPKRQKKQATLQAVAAAAAAKGGAAAKPAAEPEAQRGQQKQRKGLGSRDGGSKGKGSATAAVATAAAAPGSKRQSSAGGGGGGNGKQAGKQKLEKPVGIKAGGSKAGGKASGSSKAGDKASGSSKAGSKRNSSSKAEPKKRREAEAEAEEGEDEDAEGGPPPVTDEGGYYVEKIVGAKWRNGKPQYLIKWWGYDEVTWEPTSNLDADIKTYKLAKGVDLAVGPRNRLSVASAYKDCA